MSPVTISHAPSRIIPNRGRLFQNATGQSFFLPDAVLREERGKQHGHEEQFSRHSVPSVKESGGGAS